MTDVRPFSEINIGFERGYQIRVCHEAHHYRIDVKGGGIATSAWLPAIEAPHGFIAADDFKLIFETIVNMLVDIGAGMEGEA